MNEQTVALISPKERQIIEHSLGIADHQRRAGLRGKIHYRNHFCANEGDSELEAMFRRGLMDRGARINQGRHRYYIVTAAGAAAIGATLPTDD